MSDINDDDISTSSTGGGGGQDATDASDEPTEREDDLDAGGEGEKDTGDA